MDRLTHRHLSSSRLVCPHQIALLVEGAGAIGIEVADVVADLASDAIPGDFRLGDGGGGLVCEILEAELHGNAVAVGGIDHGELAPGESVLWVGLVLAMV